MPDNTVVKIGLMASTNVDAYTKSAVFSSDIENGSHVTLGSIVDGDLNTYNAATPSDVTEEQIFIVDEPVNVEIGGLRAGLQDPRKFINPAGRAFRVRSLKVDDEITMTVEGFTGEPVVGEYAVPANGSLKLSPASDLSGETRLAYKVEGETYIAIGAEYVTAYRLRVVKA